MLFDPFNSSKTVRLPIFAASAAARVSGTLMLELPRMDEPAQGKLTKQRYSIISIGHETTWFTSNYLTPMFVFAAELRVELKFQLTIRELQI